MPFLDLLANKECTIIINCHIFFYKVKTELILEIAGRKPYIFIYMQRRIPKSQPHISL